MFFASRMRDIVRQFDWSMADLVENYDIQYYNGSFVDDAAAKALNDTLSASCDDECYKRGCQWSIVYALAGFTLVLLAANAILLVLGGWIYRARMLGLFCHNFLNVFLLASLITTHRYRYRDQGKLAALSTMPSRTISTTEYDPNWTYQNDADWIEKFWVLQLVTFILCIVTSNLGCFKFCNRTDIRDSQVQSFLPSSKNEEKPMVYVDPATLESQPLTNDD